MRNTVSHEACLRKEAGYDDHDFVYQPAGGMQAAAGPLLLIRLVGKDEIEKIIERMNEYE
ncbi:hypothetical protein SELR_27750 [Selenomonas ruminantium subsp. lactilytica TAM6421]|uniref:Uncharacterized protein n=1 Tax=Selenomonas ruminantium subsp. lactilytica (strain NBRC 103574 / TAM6421) TaxID=927704 RepID=I0GUP6_SELRL|nr:hypothetical protein SELR_27750 [Selenomonas ruminantium subsp. lactilytica TAM6421]